MSDAAEVAKDLLPAQLADLRPLGSRLPLILRLEVLRGVGVHRLPAHGLSVARRAVLLEEPLALAQQLLGRVLEDHSIEEQMVERDDHRKDQC